MRGTIPSGGVAIVGALRLQLDAAPRERGRGNEDEGANVYIGAKSARKIGKCFFRTFVVSMMGRDKAPREGNTTGHSQVNLGFCLREVVEGGSRAAYRRDRGFLGCCVRWEILSRPADLCIHYLGRGCTEKERTKTIGEAGSASY